MGSRRNFADQTSKFKHRLEIRSQCRGTRGSVAINDEFCDDEICVNCAISPYQIIFMSDSAPLSPDSRQRTAVDIDKLRSDWLELVDQYDAIAHELRRKNIPVKRSWEPNQALATARLEDMFQLHQQAIKEQLSLDLDNSPCLKAS